jgi:hypothetical protein
MEVGPAGGRPARAALLAGERAAFVQLAVENAPLEEVEALPLDKAEKCVGRKTKLSAAGLTAERPDPAILHHTPIPILARVIRWFAVVRTAGQALVVHVDRPRYYRSVAASIAIFAEDASGSKE